MDLICQNNYNCYHNRNDSEQGKKKYIYII